MTDGFRVHEIEGNLTQEASFSQENLLNQPFYYLGKGEQFYAFLGEDKRTVLKFFRHKKSFLGKSGDLRELIKSVELGATKLPEQTAIFGTHLGKTTHLPKVVLFDKISCKHLIDLNRTEFFLQKYVQPFCTLLEEKMTRKDFMAAERLLRSLFVLLNKQCALGIHNSDTAFKRNFGGEGEAAICIDVGSLWQDESVKTEAGKKAEIARTTLRLQRWIKKHYPELLKSYEDAKKVD